MITNRLDLDHERSQIALIVATKSNSTNRDTRHYALTDLIRLHDRTHPIPTIPKPTTGYYSLMDEGNIGVDGDALVMTMTMILSKFPVPAGCQNGVSGS